MASEFNGMTMAQLVSLYNFRVVNKPECAGFKTVKRFRTLADGIKRLEALPGWAVSDGFDGQPEAMAKIMEPKPATYRRLAPRRLQDWRQTGSLGAFLQSYVFRSREFYNQFTAMIKGEVA